ncbi:MAG TPA: PQQ-binding-like beta-propeller repeat protein [Bryobacteraceae bacterium]|nr:PQQ-binding-like beta-propeller repeat protein [Bryobacteraceae bacterium]
MEFIAASRVSILVLASCAAALAQTDTPIDGDAVYRKHCALCHDKGVGRAPQLLTLSQYTPERVLAALTTGKMAEQGKALTPAESRSVAMFVTGGKAFGAEEAAKQGACAEPAAAFDKPFSGPYWNGWGVDLSNRRMQPAAMAGLRADKVPQLKLKWAFGFPGGGRAFAQPTVAGGRIFAGSDSGKVYSLDAATGCIYWMFKADTPVRTAISIGAVGAQWVAYFGDQHAQAYAVDAATGALLWKVRVEEHPAAMITGAPALYEGRLYVPDSSYEEVTGAAPKYECCKFRGAVSALDAATGKLIWKSYTIAEAPQPVRKNKQGIQLWGPSGAAVWSSPTIDPKRRAVYVTTGDDYSDPAARTSDSFLAFDMDTGKLLWSRQLTKDDGYNLACPSGDNCPTVNGPDFDFGCSPNLVDLPNGKRALVAGQKSGMVHALDPDQGGEVLWSVRVGKGGPLGGVQWGNASDGQNVYVAVSDHYATKDLKEAGGMFALKLETGERVWSTPAPPCSGKSGCSPAQSAAVTVIPGAVFSGSLDGHLRAYATADGRIIWDVDTAVGYESVNGVKARGGSLDGPGPVVVGGTLYVNSGYGMFGEMPGNVLLAFSVDGK